GALRRKVGRGFQQSLKALLEVARVAIAAIAFNGRDRRIDVRATCVRMRARLEDEERAERSGNDAAVISGPRRLPFVAAVDIDRLEQEDHVQTFRRISPADQ